MLMRLNKFIAESGYCSRRKADELITSGAVSVNEKVINSLGAQINPDNDRVEIHCQPLQPISQRVVYLLNKPRGVVTTAHDPQHRPTVLDYVPTSPRVFPCGRLDVETMGLVVLTNDGNLCYQLTHPKFEHRKTYHVVGRSKDTDQSWKMLQRPIKLKDGPVMIDELTLNKKTATKIDATLTIHDGRNHLVRRICGHCGIEVQSLTRIALGDYTLGGIEPGKYLQI